MTADLLSMSNTYLPIVRDGQAITRTGIDGCCESNKDLDGLKEPEVGTETGGHCEGGDME